MRLAFVNTALPGMTFLARDLIALMDAGVTVDLYVFSETTLDPELRRAIESRGGSVGRIAYPFNGEIGRILASEALRHPLRLASSVGLALATMVRSPAEGIRALAVLPGSLALARRIAATGAHQVHGLWAGVPASVAFWIGRHAGIAYSFSGHAWDILDRTRLLPRKVADARGMVVCSGFARDTVRALVKPGDRDRVHLVHHGLDLGAWAFAPRRPDTSPETDRPRTILAVGNLVPKKGFDVLVGACARLRDRGVAFRCEIVGPDRDFGPHRRHGEELRSLASGLGLPEVVQFAGGLSPLEVRERMSRAHVLACPSVAMGSTDSDGIPNVVVEAMALGLPVVTTDAGGLPEIVRDGDTGRRVPQRDPGALAAALEDALADRAASLERAARGRRELETSFDAGVTTRQFLAAIGMGRSAAGADRSAIDVNRSGAGSSPERVPVNDGIGDQGGQ